MKQALDVHAFGKLVRARRREQRISQEALAAEAFGNPNRKGYVSALENGRLNGLRSETVKRLADALALGRQEIPWSLRWPEPEDFAVWQAKDSETPQISGAQLIPLLHFVEDIVDQMKKRLRRSFRDVYNIALGHGLDTLTQVFGCAFSSRSFYVSLTIAFGYVFLSWTVASSRNGGFLGNLELFSPPSWADRMPQPVVAVGIICLALGASVYSYLWASPRPSDIGSSYWAGRSHIWRVRAVRILASACLLGTTVYLASLMGVHSIVAGMLLVVSGLCALSNLPPFRAAFVGAMAGVLASFLESVMVHRTVVDGIEGAIFGLVVGGSAAFWSARIADRTAHRFAGAGAGAVAGAMIAVFFFAAVDIMFPRADTNNLQLLSLSDTSLLVVALVWVVLPVVNAGLDFVSYGASHWLAGVALRANTTLRLLILLALVDFFVAVGLAIMTVVSVCLALWACNLVLEFGFELQTFLTSWVAKPFGENIWLTLMIMSTLSWSVIHYFLVLLPSCAAFVASGPLLTYARANLSQNMMEQRVSLRTYLLTMGPHLAFVCTYALLVSLTFVLLSGLLF